MAHVWIIEILYPFFAHGEWIVSARNTRYTREEARRAILELKKDRMLKGCKFRIRKYVREE